MEPIITARKDVNVERVFALVNRGMLKRHFHQIWTVGFENLRNINPQYPVIFYANHSNWWDGLIAFYLTRDLLKFDGYLMMMAKQLRKYSFFRWIGAFSIDRQSPISAYRSLEYAANLLNSSNKKTCAVWIFPQGELLPNDIRPIKFLRGLVWLIKHVPQVQLVAVTFRYEFLNEQLPEVFISFNQPTQILNLDQAKTLNLELQTSLTNQLEALKADIINQKTQHYKAILKGKLSLNIMYEKFRQLIGWQ
ncbi:MAG: lysophospholipid acyltransferase family protein [Blastocatellia bacterium]|nr:lysophospholipid acyltransferase family protein [Blastocatellia bacterium]